MLLPLAFLDQHALHALVQEQFGVSNCSLEFRPLGEDSWAYECGPLWVSVRRDLRGHIPAAYATAAALVEQGLDFVLAPLAGADGKYTHQIGRFPIVVFPLCPSTSLDREKLSIEDLGAITDMLNDVHAGTPADGLPAEDYGLPFEKDLTDALVRAKENIAPPAGPYDLPLRQSLRHNCGFLADLRAQAYEFGAYCATAGAPMVLTHGEPSTPNWVRAGKRLLLVDWGGAAQGPAARDWFHLRRTMPFLAPPDDGFQRFYQLRWCLSEIAEYVTVFSQLHAGSREDQAMWGRLARYLPNLPSVALSRATSEKT